MESSDPVVICSHLVKIYDSAVGRVQAVRGVDLELERGKATAVIGPSGSGKSSLLRMIAGLERPTAGTALVAGVDLHRLRPGRRAKARAELLTHVYQRPSDNLIAHLTARQQLDRVVRGPRGLSADDAMRLMGLGDRAGHMPSELSGGEQQRLAFARAGVAGHPLIIADEPTSQLDSENVQAVLDVVFLLIERGASVLLATHDARILTAVDQVVTLRDGAVATITAAGSELAVIDSSGRLQLAPNVLDSFPDRRAKVTWDENQERLTLDPP